MRSITDRNVIIVKPLVPPQEVKEAYPMSETILKQVDRNRYTIEQILARKDKRLMVIVGPCSIHDPVAALDYGRRLAKLAAELKEHLFIVMRAYFAKPRTTTGWKGLIYDPDLDGSYDIQKGIGMARELVVALCHLDLPLATEVLDAHTIQYIDDAISWSAIGARTTESQHHRELASGLSMPVGFKNTTDGSIGNAVNAVMSANHPHHFWGMDTEGRTAYIPSKGNPWAHIVLRGGAHGPNYRSTDIAHAVAECEKAGILSSVIVDCSHDNSGKDFRQQHAVLKSVLDERQHGQDHLIGVMLESFLQEGKQKLPDTPTAADIEALQYGLSITDGCMSFDETERILREAYNRRFPFV